MVWLDGKICLIMGGVRGMGVVEVQVFLVEGGCVWIVDILGE